MLGQHRVVGREGVEVVGLDGVSATVVEGRYGLWLPQSLADSATELVARDANGALPDRERAVPTSRHQSLSLVS